MKKILVVDSDALILKFVDDVLSKQGYEVVTAGDGLSALDILKTVTPDAVITDLVMPNIDGRRLCKIIRGMAHLKDICLIILSAVAAEEKIDIAELDADGCIAKGPFLEMARHLVGVLDQFDIAGSRSSLREVIGVKDLYPRANTRELLSVKRHFEAVLEGMSEGILEITPQGRVIYANSAACSFINVEETRLLGSHLADVFFNGVRKQVSDLIKTLDDAPIQPIQDAPMELNGRLLTFNILHGHPCRGYCS
ncbi:MAG: response regulator [Deltaproteobacteria bacterium]|nr:response regulator [Deltaproteobacteria bacterium]